MNKRFLTGLLTLFCLSFIASKCYAWPPEPYIRIPDWHVHAPVGEYADVYAVVENDDEAGPIEYWVWTKSSGLSFSDTPVEEEYYSAASFYSYTTGRYDVDVTGTDYWGQSDSDWAYFYVFKMDLDIDGVSDNDEEDPGGYICVNGDDDNDNDTPDKDETGTVSGEDDLVEISLAYEPSTLSPGYAELELPYSTHIKVWSSSEKGTLIVDKDNRTKRWLLSQMPSTLWVEGYSSGDADLWLLYTDDGQNYPGGTDNHDPVKFTVIDVDVVSADASDPYSTKINYQINPFDAIVPSVSFTAPGTSDSKSNVSGSFYFTYDQSDAGWNSNTIRLEYCNSGIVDCTVTKTEEKPDDMEVLSAYFLAGGVGLRLYNHYLRETCDPHVYSCSYSGKTIYTMSSTVIMYFAQDLENIAGWGENHNYSWAGGGTGSTSMSWGEGLLPPGAASKHCNTKIWCIPNSLKGIADCTGLLYDYGDGTAVGVITNSEVDVSMP